MRVLFDRKKNDSAEESIPEGQTGRLYEIYKAQFVGYMQKRYQLEEDSALDIYHDSFLVLMDNVRTGKYQKRDASLLTYLVGIGRNLVLRKFRKEDELPLISEWIRELLPDSDWKQALDTAYRLVDEDDSVCNRILKLFYWERKSMEEIADSLGYRSADVAKSKKSSCMRRFSFELRRRLGELGIYFRLGK